MRGARGRRKSVASSAYAGASEGGRRKEEGGRMREAPAVRETHHPSLITPFYDSPFYDRQGSEWETRVRQSRIADNRVAAAPRRLTSGKRHEDRRSRRLPPSFAEIRRLVEASARLRGHRLRQAARGARRGRPRSGALSRALPHTGAHAHAAYADRAAA